MSMFRKSLLTLMVISAVGSTVSAGTFASFTGSTLNTGTVATGSVRLSTQKNIETACFSTGVDTDIEPAVGGQVGDDAGNAYDCPASLITATVQRPGEQVSVNLTVENTGSLDGILHLYASQACQNLTLLDVAAVEDPCGTVQVNIQEYDTEAERTANDPQGPKAGCRFGTASAGNTKLCMFDPVSPPSPHRLSSFAAAYPPGGAGSTINLGNLGPVGGPTKRFFKISIKLPENATNAIQGRKAKFGFSWQLVA